MWLPMRNCLQLPIADPLGPKTSDRMTATRIMEGYEKEHERCPVVCHLHFFRKITARRRHPAAVTVPWTDGRRRRHGGNDNGDGDWLRRQRRRLWHGGLAHDFTAAVVRRRRG